MTFKRSDIRRVVVGKAVGAVFAFLLGVWMLWEVVDSFGGLSDPLVGILSPVWAPVYLAILYASGLRNNYFLWLENGILFYLLIALLLYLEAVLLAGIYRTLQAGYRSYRQGKRGETLS
jgi:ABC-type nitrate/sulfonate/bicarbonate transport system permease component